MIDCELFLLLISNLHFSSYQVYEKTRMYSMTVLFFSFKTINTVSNNKKLYIQKDSFKAINTVYNNKKLFIQKGKM